MWHNPLLPAKIGKGRVKKRGTRDTYPQAILECLASDGQRLEELGNGLAACLGVPRRAGWGTLGRREVGDALGRMDGDIGPSHCVGYRRYELKLTRERRYM